MYDAPMSRRTTQASPARIAAVEVLTRLAEAYPDLPLVEPDVAGLDARDARLAVAIHRTVVQRWLTLRSILNTFLRQRLEQLEPPLQAVLLAGAAQLVFMARIPAYAVIDESVAQAKRRVRPGAGGLVNAVLRKVGGCVVDREVQGRWEPAADGVPWEQGAIYFDRPVVPDPQHLDAHLAACA